ncbi:hypothetical protein [Shinella sp.]
MTKVLLLGAGGQIAHHVIDALANDGEIEMTPSCRSFKPTCGILENCRSA